MTEPIQYREYTIESEGEWYYYKHCEFTGAEDKRYGSAVSISEAKSDIDNLTIEEQEHTIEVLRKKIADLELLLEVEKRYSKELTKEKKELQN